MSSQMMNILSNIINPFSQKIKFFFHVRIFLKMRRNNVHHIISRLPQSLQLRRQLAILLHLVTMDNHHHQHHDDRLLVLHNKGTDIPDSSFHHAGHFRGEENHFFRRHDGHHEDDSRHDEDGVYE